jgi:hypothetical protein
MAESSDEPQPYTFVEHLWIVRKDHQTIAEDLYRDRDGWDVRFLSDGHWFASDASRSRELAIIYADALKQAFLAEGWRS